MLWQCLIAIGLDIIGSCGTKSVLISLLPPHFSTKKSNLMELLEHSDDVFTIQNLWSPAACQKIIQQSEKEGFERALVNTASGPVAIEDFRNNDRLFWEDEDLAAQIWEEIEEFVPCDLGEYQAIGLNELFRFYRYDVQQQFNWHYDGIYQPNQNERSFYTFMIYLNDDFEGGETAFSNFKVKSQTGDGLFFSQELEHAGLPIISGRKYVLRTDIMYSNAM